MDTCSGRGSSTTTSPQATSERERTDLNLQAERERADQALEEDRDALEEAADAIVSRARARADALLLAARAETDRLTGPQPPASTLQRSRALEDHVLGRERDTADRVLRNERADHVAILSNERQQTDQSLFHERARSDRALATRDEFMGVISHDLLNLLNAIVGAAALVESGAAEDDAERVTRHARRIQRAAARMHRLVGDLVDVASIEAGALAVTRVPCDPADVVNEAIETFQSQASGCGVTIAADLAPPLRPVPFDPARILQVLGNLLSNAVKFTPPGGSAAVHVEDRGDDILFAVSDTGPGIPLEELERVFERFVQLASNDRRGFGLGLYISKCIVEGHAGRIWAEKRREGGSTFCFTLPVP